MAATRVHLSRDREQTLRMHHRAMHQINDVLGVCLNSTRAKEDWTCLRRDRQLELYAKRSSARGAGSSALFLGVNEAACSFDEAFELLHFNSTAQFRLMMKLMHGRDFKDGTLLSMRTRQHSRADWTFDTQHAAVWLAFQDRRKSVLLREQSFTLFQTLKVFLPENAPQRSYATQQDDQSSVGAGSVSASSSMAGLNARPSDGVHKRTMALSWLPFPQSADASAQDERQVDLQYTLIVEEIARDRLRLSCVTSTFHDGNEGRLAGSPRTVRSIARRLALRSVGKLESAVAASRIGGRKLVAPHQWVKDEERAACVSCGKRFNAVFRRRHHCRLCGDVVCGSCCSLRATNVVNTKTNEVQKALICHICNNKARFKTDSFVSTTETYPDNQNQQGEADQVYLPPPVRVLPAGLKAVATGHESYGGFKPPRLAKPADTKQQQRVCSNNDRGDESDETDEFGSGSSGSGYMGMVPGNGGAVACPSSKVISIKSMTRSGVIKKASWLPESMKAWACPTSSGDSLGSEAASFWEEASTELELERSRSFLHPAALAPGSRQPGNPLRMTTETSNCSYGEDQCVLSPRGGIDDEEEAERRAYDHRRTSVMSSNVGLLDQEYVEDSYFLPRLDAEREKQRLEMLQLIVSPACTLVDPNLMDHSCEVAAGAFGVEAAFIARVDEHYVVVEHAIGSPGLHTQDEVVRRESLCDFVLVQPQQQPLVVLDCLADPRTREIPMVQRLRMRFFIGISICVRGLPIAVLCAFSQDNGNESDDKDEDTQKAASPYDLEVLENAARTLENELESLVHGLRLS